MARLVAKRIVSAIPLLFGLLTIVFLISRLAPGDPLAHFISPKISPQVAEELRKQFGLDQPILIQYVSWLTNALKGDLGTSFSHQRPVAKVILTFLPNTALLAAAAIVIEVIVGLFLGSVAVRCYGSWLDKLVANTTLVVYTLPTFWVGFLLLTIFAYGLQLFPSSLMYSVDSESLPALDRAIDLLKHLILPACAIAISGAAAIARYFRSSLLKVQNSEYVTAARSLGVTERKIFFCYQLPNAVAPVITILGLEIGTLLTGAIVTETIFSWPGMGRLAVLAILARDYPLVMGCTLISGVVVIVGNLVADFLYARVDPRVRVVS